MFFFFPHIMFYCYQILCFSMSNDLNAFNFFIYSYSSLMKYFFSTSEFCVVYIHFTGYQMKA